MDHVPHSQCDFMERMNYYLECLSCLFLENVHMSREINTKADLSKMVDEVLVPLLFLSGSLDFPGPCMLAGFSH